LAVSLYIKPRKRHNYPIQNDNTNVQYYKIHVNQFKNIEKENDILNQFSFIKNTQYLPRRNTPNVHHTLFRAESMAYANTGISLDAGVGQ
jgi:hypothetical protein